MFLAESAPTWSCSVALSALGFRKIRLLSAGAPVLAGEPGRRRETGEGAGVAAPEWRMEHSACSMHEVK